MKQGKDFRIVKKIVLVSLLLAAVFTFLLDNNYQTQAFQEEITFNNQVVRIFQRNCQVCHHPGDIAPFSLMTYSESRPWARSIQEKVVLREMPPWKPVDGCGDFEGSRRMTDEEISTISQWVERGSPEGAASDLPEPLTFASSWPLGQPDAVLRPDADYTVKPGQDIYRCFTMPTTELRGERFLSAIDIKPVNRAVVHHVILYLDETGVSKQLDDADPGPGYTSFGGPGFPTTGALGGWAPGARARFEPDGNGWRVPAGARIVAQVHYHPLGDQASTDRTEIGLYFARQPVKKEIRVLFLGNESFAIPAGDSRYKVSASATVPPGLGAHALAIFPHMHLLGREIRVEAAYPDGATRCLVDIGDWSFNWQGFYYYKEPAALPPGTRLSLTSYYDNSANNPRNPNSPPKVVRFGEQTTDEMCIAALTFTLDSESRSLSAPEITNVSVDAREKLIIAGRGFTNGADIEINGQRVADSLNHKKKKKASKQLTSSRDWKSLVPPGTQVSITVLSTDGVRSSARVFAR